MRQRLIVTRTGRIRLFLAGLILGALTVWLWFHYSHNYLQLDGIDGKIAQCLRESD